MTKPLSRPALAAFCNGNELLALLPLPGWQLPTDENVGSLDAMHGYPEIMIWKRKGDYDGSLDRFFIRDDISDSFPGIPCDVVYIQVSPHEVSV